MDDKEEFVTTGVAAKLCHVTPPTIRKCLSLGLLEGNRLKPWRWRISRKSLDKLLHDLGIPPASSQNKSLPKVLLVAQEEPLIHAISDALGSAGLFDLVVAKTDFDAQTQALSLKPDCVAVDFSIGYEEALGLCKGLREVKRLARSLIIAILPEGVQTSFDRSSFSQTLRKPFNPRVLVERLTALIAH